MAERGTRFGPQPHQYDPYDGLSDDEIDAEMEALLGQSNSRSITISIRMPVDLLQRTKRVAAAGGVPYQSLIKRLVDSGVSRLEKRPR